MILFLKIFSRVRLALLSGDGTYWKWRVLYCFFLVLWWGRLGKEKKIIPRYLCAADMLLLPNAPLSLESIRYTSPIKMFEYMASGVPIIASDLPSVREVLTERNAVLVDAGSASALADGIKRVVDDSVLAVRVSQEALQDAKDCTWKFRAQTIFTFFNAIIK